MLIDFYKDRFSNAYEEYSFNDVFIIFNGCPIFIGEPRSNALWAKKIAEILESEPEELLTLLKDFFGKATGLFSIVVFSKNAVYLIADIIRSHPIFYGYLKSDVFITSNLCRFQEKYGKLIIDEGKIEEFVVSGYTWGSGTIYKGTNCLQAGEIVSIEDQKVTSKRYFEFKPDLNIYNYKGIQEFTEDLDNILLSVFNRMILNFPDVHRWIVPLSGGHDSRLIVNYLSKLKVRNVICFSYGNIDNMQSAISKSVANILGYEWHFIEYTEEKWFNLHRRGIIDEYIKYAFNGVSTPILQDLLALCELKDIGVVESQDIFVPGHTLDFITGGHCKQPDLDTRNKHEAIKNTYLRHTRIKKRSSLPVKTIDFIFDNTIIEPSDFQEYFNWQERQAKYIVNHIRVYEYLGLRYWLPYWDKEIVDFWKRIPQTYRCSRRIFFDSERQGILIQKLMNMPYAEKKHSISHRTLMKTLQVILPSTVLRLLRLIRSKNHKFDEGLNQIYALRADTVESLIAPMNSFPKGCAKYFKDIMHYSVKQVSPNFLTTLFTLRNNI